MANFEWVTKVHRFIYHHSKGRFGANLGVPMVLMYTIGAKTGISRVIPLQCYSAEPEGVMVLASNGGQEKVPGWYFNLKAHPEINILVGRQKRLIRAEELNDERRHQVWPKMRIENKAIDNYAADAGRPLPVMLLRTLKVY